jgi:hypothetical protein
MRNLLIVKTLLVLILAASSALGGPYAPAAGQPGATAISATDSRIIGWATGATIVRGLRKIDNPSGGYAYYGGPTGTPAIAAPIGMPPQPQTNYYSVALGQGGTATLTFATPIAHTLGLDGNHADFAVFTNGFAVDGDDNMEWVKPAFVEVSSDGVHFFRFPSVSLTQTGTQVAYSDDNMGAVDATDLYNLAGKDPVGYGTPFNLGELAGVSSLLDIYSVKYVRLVDCVGDINPAYATYDSQGHIVNSPWPGNSLVGSEGFCLAGVGVLHDYTSVAAEIDSIRSHFRAPASSQWKLAADGLPVGPSDIDYYIRNILHTAYGDANLDGKVDALDFQALLNHWQDSNQGWAHADFNGDGMVEALDFQQLLNNWNPTGSGLGQIPEPASVILLLAGAAAFMRKRRG